MNNFNLTLIQGKNVIIDVARLFSDEVVYINATKLALQFGKNKQRLNEFFKTKSFIEYENAISKVTKNRDFKIDDKPLKYSIKGKYGGTYLHSDLVIVFLRWLNVEFAIKCDMYIKQQIQEAHNEKIILKATKEANRANDEWVKARKHSIHIRKALSSTIKSFCEYAQSQRGEAYKNDKCPYYIKLTSLIYKALNIKQPKRGYSLRDVYSGAVVEKIEYLENILIDLLKQHIEEKTEYHKAFKSIKEIINYEAIKFVEVA